MEPPPTPRKTRAPLRIEVYLDERGEHRWRAIARNGRIVADSGEGYKRRADVRKALRLIAASPEAFASAADA